MKYFDKKNNRLVFIEEAATEEFWSDHWLKKPDIAKRIKKGAQNGMIKKFTKKFLSPPARVIDAGCGIGQNVYGLQEWGYDAFGVDYATSVVQLAKEQFPDLKLFSQDVKALDFPNEYFDGYWSLGVIEHFENGYSDIIKEANRVLRPGGYLLVSVPWFSPLRKLKAKMSLYPLFSEGVNTDQFYEFMLDEEKVIESINKEGFKFIKKYPFDAVKGLKDEIKFFRLLFQWVYDGRNIIFKSLRFFITLIGARFSGHIIVLVFRKNERKQ